jgi:hypothetical protein
MSRKEMAMRMLSINAFFLLPFLLAGSLFGQVITNVTPGNLVSFSATTVVTQDPTSKVYTYSYTVTSAPASKQGIWFIAIQFTGDLRPTLLNPTSPPGWSFSKHNDGPFVSWAATDPGPDPVRFVDDGGVPPSPFEVSPGKSLSGFSFQSPNPPDSAIIYAQGFTPLSSAVDAGDLLVTNSEIKAFEDNSVIGVTTAPRGDSAIQGTGQKSVDGFLAFLNLTNKAVRASPISVSLKFSISGETIDRSTFAASLNGVDVTSSFGRGVSPADLVASFTSGASPLRNGRNVLYATVLGTDPVTLNPAADLDRVVFFVNNLGEADLNGDGQVNCLDLAIVKGSFGKVAGQAGFDPRADVNKDGVVNIVDLSTVARQLPAGTTCP